jgi:hypothetical protein
MERARHDATLFFPDRARRESGRWTLRIVSSSLLGSRRPFLHFTLNQDTLSLTFLSDTDPAGLPPAPPPPRFLDLTIVGDQLKYLAVFNSDSGDQEIPEPSALILFSIGTLGMLYYARRGWTKAA